MANLKEVRERISSVISTQQITKAMKMVAAAKLRRSQQAILQLRPYSLKLNEILSNILSNVGSDEAGSSFGTERPVKKALVVVITSNRGLCGAYNTNVIKSAVRIIEERYSDLFAKGDVTVLPIGKKGYDFFRRRYPQAPRIDDYVQLVGKEFSFNESLAVSELLMQQFENEAYDAIELVYSQFKNAATQIFAVERFLPVAKAQVEENANVADFIFEPGKEEILTGLIPTILKTQFYKAILDASASEHGARMTAMDKASENADELLRDLRINYNKARQEAITKELSEIVGGVAALESE